MTKISNFDDKMNYSGDYKAIIAIITAAIIETITAAIIALQVTLVLRRVLLL